MEAVLERNPVERKEAAGAAPRDGRCSSGSSRPRAPRNSRPKQAARIQNPFADPAKLDATCVNEFMSTLLTNSQKLRGGYGIVVLAIFETELSVPAVV
jgi:hypothetical protein